MDYNFSIIPNLFDSDKPIAIAFEARIIENVRTKCIIFGEALRIRVKKFKENLRENYSKSIKIAITACDFSKMFRGSIPLDLPRAFLDSQSASNYFSRKKCLKNMVKLWLPPFKISRYANNYCQLTFLYCSFTARPNG